MEVSLQMLLFIALIIVVAKAAGGLSARFGLPTVLGELFYGRAKSRGQKERRDGLA
jgi:Kef-type K+ transport system membrane component KefB